MRRMLLPARAAWFLFSAACAHASALESQARPVRVAQAPAEVKPSPPLQPQPDAGQPQRSEEPKPAEKPPPAKPPPPQVKALVDRVQAFYEKTLDFTARFQQVYTYRAFKRSQTSTGKVVFKKPALMRWDYQTPSPKSFVLAGDKVYAHDPEAKTLTKASIAQNQLSASVTFLWGQGKLADEFSIQEVACKNCLGLLLELTPRKPDPRFRQIRLEVDPKTAQVLRSVVVDPDGSENAISFLDLKTNTGVTEQHFKLAPPQGTQIIDYTQGTR